jgi:hypothetical protein
MNSIGKSCISALLADAAYRFVNSEYSPTDLVRARGTSEGYQGQVFYLTPTSR